jgi:SAM-dependent methyltransferase
MSNPYAHNPYAEEYLRSPREVVPLVLDLLKPNKIKSVIDVGCGAGFWLAAFKENGVDEVWGIDSDNTHTSQLLIPKDQFVSFDLTQPIHIDKEFDLVISLEVGEHLPEECGTQFVESLTRLAPVVLFSAAIPYQGGPAVEIAWDQHLNEQWPDYWADRFRQKSYVVIDCLRRRIWDNEKVLFWYAQNTFIFVKESCLENYPSLKKEFTGSVTSQLSIVHPKEYLEKVQEAECADIETLGLKDVLSAIPKLITNAIKRRV